MHEPKTMHLTAASSPRERERSSSNQPSPREEEQPSPLEGEGSSSIQPSPLEGEGREGGEGGLLLRKRDGRSR